MWSYSHRQAYFLSSRELGYTSYTFTRDAKLSFGIRQLEEKEVKEKKSTFSVWMFLYNMEINLLKFVFISMTFSIVFVGSLINTIEKYLPIYIVQTFRYGKFSYKGKVSFIQPIEVPKRWFRHFYVFAAIFSSLTTFIVMNVYFCKGQLDTWVMTLLDILAPRRSASVSSLNVVIAVILLTIHSWHRLYETWFVSVFSDAKINIAHYFIGYFHYFGSFIAILAESPGFISLNDTVPEIKVSDLSLVDILASSLFLWSCFHQYKSSIILANLRKNHEGKVVTEQYKIPFGGWFEYVSSPHFLAEIIMYFSLTCILWGTSIWPWVFFWVLSNQVESAILSHWWYKTKFEDYPSQRKAIIPFVL